MIYHNQNKDHYPELTACERRDMTKRFIAISGPEYHEVTVTLLEFTEDDVMGDSAIVEWHDDSDPLPDFLTRQTVSYASWYILRAAKPGDVVTVKIRSDDVGLGI